jgi:plasmid stabilization system protein ParE
MIFVVQDGAAYRIKQLYHHGRERWGAAASKAYVAGLFDTFDRIADGLAHSRPIPAEFGVVGFITRYRSHLIYWRPLDPGTIGIVSVLHERMHQTRRFRDDVEN